MEENQMILPLAGIVTFAFTIGAVFTLIYIIALCWARTRKPGNPCAWCEKENGTQTFGSHGICIRHYESTLREAGVEDDKIRESIQRKFRAIQPGKIQPQQ